jgi:hypothetical protein
LTHRVGAPVGGATHQVGAPAPGRFRQVVMQRSMARARERAGGAPKPVAEEARGPQSGRAQEERRAPTGKVAPICWP